MPLAVCATPIGNLEDVTLRVLRELREADVVLCEDTRRTRILLQRHGISAALVSYHEHNEAKRVAELLPRLVAGERVALVTDAGLPGVSDPGVRLVDTALDAGVPVTVLPGPTAVETALVASGFEATRYQFLGFLPRGERALASLWAELAGWPWVMVGYESPRRLPVALESLAAALPDRLVAGERVALVTDAGLPGVSDPGVRLVDAAFDAGVPVTVLPGPTAVETALVASGFEANRYQFLGFLPRGERPLASLWAELAGWPWVVVAYESPRRLPVALESLAAALPDRLVAVCRELTKLHEEVVRGPVRDVAARFAEPVKGEVTLVIGPGEAVESRADEDARSAVAELVQAGTPRRTAADVVSRLTGISKNRLYRESL